MIFQFRAYIKASIMKMDRVTHFHIKFYINFDSVFDLDIGKPVHVNYQLLMPEFWKWI